MSNRISFNVSWTTIGTLVRQEVARGLYEKDLEDLEREHFRGKTDEVFHEYLKKIGAGTKEECDRLKEFADGGCLNPLTIAKWKEYHDRPDSEKTDLIEASIHGGKWGKDWVRLLSTCGEVQASPQVKVYGFELVQGRNLPIELIEEVRVRIKRRKEKYSWNDLCSSDDCLQVTIDGDQWCALIGPNIQEGWAGFGDSKSEAILNLYKEMAKD